MRVALVTNKLEPSYYRAALVEELERHWMATFAAGARRVDPVAVDPEVAALAISMTRAVCLDMAGVDLLRGADGRLYALEINSDFGLVHAADRDRGTPMMCDLLEQLAG